ncbi:uncharacterized protein DUF4249 [Chitinophaga dinghuensis]|uniref:Uncharacterized protein DUF4249 n=1 Tax=Chitinophaga dinghuensis TaxID=1539050 RepID=A0A327VW11_9BACT|nr:DUF4249 family protein [Chitinophaga dinghuensis]RAJ79155.1 uncharacterized protein DUF4249 [Chitinophaga dinghuensis]
MRLMYLTVLSILLLTACESELPLPPGNGQPRVVVYSELTAGQTAEIRVGKSKIVQPGVDNAFDLVPDAVVQLLNRDSSLIETLGFGTDTSNRMSVYTGKVKLNPNTFYRVKVDVPGMRTVTSFTTIPNNFKVDLLDTSRTILNGRPVLQFHLTIHAQPGQRQYIVMEALKQSAQLDSFFTYNGVRYSVAEYEDLYERVKDQPGVVITKDTTFLNDYLRIPVYTQDENADNNQIGGLNENYNSILFTQLGKPFTTNLYINATALSSNQVEAIAPKGRVLVYVKSVSKEYYDFLLTYEKVKRNPGLNSLIQAVQLRNNTVGGLGVVGGTNQILYQLYYDVL